jgi:hypothetical protein
MATNKQKDSEGFSGPKKPLNAPDLDDVEGHKQPLPRGDAPDSFSGPKKPLFSDIDDDSVEGHKK